MYICIYVYTCVYIWRLSSPARCVGECPRLRGLGAWDLGGGCMVGVWCRALGVEFEG